jgi:O-antigen ligase
LTVLAMAIALFGRDMRDTSTVLCHVASGLLVMSAVVLAAHLVAPDELGLNRGELVEGGDVGIAHPSTAAATAVVGLVVTLAAALLWDWRWPRWLLVPACLIHGGVIFTAASRSAVGIVTLLLAVMGGTLLSRQMRAAVALPAGLAGAAYLVLDPGQELLEASSRRVAEYLERGASEGTISSLSGRTELWDAIWEEFLTAPWRGHGFFVTSRDGQIDVWDEPSNFTAHNLMLQVLATTGLIGAGLFLIGVGRWVWTAAAGLTRRAEVAGLLPYLLLIALWIVAWGQISESFMGALYPESVAIFASVGLAIGGAVVQPVAGEGP